MKVQKDSLDISNKKKSALPSSKLLKPKKFKSLKKYAAPLSTDKLKLVNENLAEHLDENHDLINHKSSKNSLNLEEKGRAKKSKNSIEKPKIKTISNLFDFTDQLKHLKEQNEKPEVKGKGKNGSPLDKSITKKNNLGKLQASKIVDDNLCLALNEENEASINSRPKRNLKVSKEPVHLKQSKKEKVIGRMGNTPNTKQDYDIQNKSVEKQLESEIVDKRLKKGTETAGIDKCKLKTSKVASVTKGLLKLINNIASSKPEILDVGEPVFLQLECIKIPICETKQLRFKLPYPLTDETSDVLLITADLKGHKIYPDRAVDHYEEFFTKHQINFITKVMPLRMVKKEYSQYEMKRKLVDQFDVILADSRIIKSLPAILGKFALYKRKMPIPVNLTIGESKLKKHLEDAICKTQMTVKSNGHSSVVQIGHSKMSAKEIAANVIEVAKSLEKLYPGGWKNIRSLIVKTTLSTSLPVYLSLLSPNEVKIPVEVHKKPPPVEGELSTMPGHNVIVTADGNVILKKIDEDLKIDDSKDDEILEEAEKYLESIKTVRYDESSDEEKNEKEDSESDDEGEAITEAMEKKLMNKYEKSAKAKKKNKEEKEDEEEEEEEEEEESEKEEKIVPMTGKKRKLNGTKKQSGPPVKKAFNAVESKGKKKINKSNMDNKKEASPGFKKPQMRGTRAGKKGKMSKDQRKALIKRKKAGKK